MQSKNIFMKRQLREPNQRRWVPDTLADIQGGPKSKPLS